jgi:hypothetical protein
MKGGVPLFFDDTDNTQKQSHGDEEKDDENDPMDGAISQRYGGKATLTHRSEAFRSGQNAQRMRDWLAAGVPIVLLMWKLVFAAVAAVKARGAFVGKTVRLIDWICLNYPAAYGKSKAGLMAPHVDGMHLYTHRLVLRFTKDGSISGLEFKLPGFDESYMVQIRSGHGLLATGSILKRESATYTHEVRPVAAEMYTLVVDLVIE